MNEKINEWSDWKFIFTSYLKHGTFKGHKTPWLEMQAKTNYVLDIKYSQLKVFRLQVKIVKSKTK